MRTACFGPVQQWERGGKHIAYRGKYVMDGKSIHFLDNSIAKIDPETGYIKYVKSCAEMLRDNGLEHLILRSEEPQDPMHLNDVEPALFSGAYFNKGDLFLSFRNLQCVLQFRPSSGEIVRVIDGPLAAQHDVDIFERFDPRHLQQCNPRKRGQLHQPSSQISRF